MPSSIFSELNLLFLDFVAYQDSYVIKYNQITTAREIKDTEWHTYHKEKDEKYSIMLINRRYKDELVKMKCEAKDNLLRDIKKIIKDKKFCVIYRTNE